MTSDRPVLLTGATGFLGSRIARALLGGGARLRLLHRPGREAALAPAVSGESADRVEAVVGDLRDRASIERACAGCRAVVHAAARVRRGGGRAAFESVNVAGFENVMAAAGHAGADRVVYTSSFFALGPSPPGAAVDERALEGGVPSDPGDLDAYQASKRRAALRALAAHSAGEPVVVLYPGTLVGPGPDTEGNFVTALLRDHLRGRVVPLPVGGRRRWSFAHVDDVAAAHVAALDHPAPAGAYVLGGTNAGLAELFAVAAELTGRRPPRVSVPFAGLWLAGLGEELLELAIGREPRQLTRGAARLLARDWALDSGRARRDLGYAPRSLQATVADTIAWLARTGRLPPGMAAAGARVINPEVLAERRRKAVHLGCALFALSLRWLHWKGALLLAVGALLFNHAVLPRLGGHALHRPKDRERGFSVGILLYPASLALLVLLFRDRLDVVAAAWGLLAVGDGMAGVVGRTAGRSPLPWNGAKSWEGLLAFVVFGATAAGFLMAWTSGVLPLDGTVAVAFASPALPVAALVAALVCAGLESLDSGVDDNLLVPVAGAGTAWLVLGLFDVAAVREPEELAPRLLLALGLCGLLAVAALLTASLSVSGAVAAALLGGIVAGFGGWGAFLVLTSFFVLGTAATRAGRRVKEARGIGEDRGGRRAAGNVIANGGFAGLCALLVLPAGSTEAPGLAGLALVGALATAAFDTVSSEVGKAWGRFTVLPLSGRAVEPGTEGAVSLEGTVAGTLAGLAIGLVGLAVGLVPRDPAGGAVLAVACGAFLGSGFESVVGEACSRRGREVHNDLLNFANTAVGGLATVGLWLA